MRNPAEYIIFSVTNSANGCIHCHLLTNYINYVQLAQIRNWYYVMSDLRIDQCLGTWSKNYWADREKAWFFLNLIFWAVRNFKFSTKKMDYRLGIVQYFLQVYHWRAPILTCSSYIK
jgi:hypothetical protein